MFWGYAKIFQSAPDSQFLDNKAFYFSKGLCSAHDLLIIKEKLLNFAENFFLHHVFQNGIQNQPHSRQVKNDILNITPLLDIIK